jgi:8-amino-7-oxononanoate synthase
VSPTDSRWTRWAGSEADGIRAADQWREPRSFDAAGPRGRLTATGQSVVSFASNDYLGLSQHPTVKAAAVAAVERWGTGAGASRHVVGSRPVHHDLEAALAGWRRTEAATVFPTGYAANLGVLSTLGRPGVRIHSDALNHASIIDGCRLARANGAEVRVHPHGDLDALADALAEAGADRQVVVTDSVFSMDGDVAAVDELMAVCRRHDALLVLDEAHAVLQPVPSPTSDGPVVLQVGTLSKTLGSLGGFLAGPVGLVELVVNRARTGIFTTALSPADAAAALAAVGVLTSAEGEGLRTRLHHHVQRLRPGHETPVLAVVLGEEARAMAASAELLAQGLLVPAIRPPTVAPGTSRLRVALSAAHTPDEVEQLAAAIARLDAPVGGHL